ncbi:hypothetical protein ACFLS1_02005 [Verrucomicrobiota bacterium]
MSKKKKTKLPELKIKSVPGWQKQRFARWLAEWEIDKELKLSKDVENDKRPTETTPQLCEQDVDNVIDPVRNEPPVRSGQIRLLSPEISPVIDRPLYVAVLQESKHDSFLAAPYSRFSEPASNGELLTGRKVPCVKVLCLWNAHSIPSNILQKSWMVDDLSEDEKNEAMTLFKHLTEKANLPIGLEKRVGPPIYHPEDPRKIYQQEEAELMKVVQERPDTAVTYHLEQKKELPLAAESRTPYETGKDLKNTVSESRDDKETENPPKHD